MTLEEKISFYSRESAAEFQKYLRDAGCPSRITVTHTFSGTPYFEGTIASFVKLIDRLTAKEADCDLDELKNDLLERKTTLEEFFAAHKPGDLIEETAPSRLLAQAETINETGGDVEKLKAGKFVKTLMILATLEDNGLLETLEDGDCYKLTGIKNPDDLTVMYPYTEFTGVTEEDLKETTITSHIQASSNTDYIVTAGAEILFTESLDDLADVLDNLDVDEDEAGRFVDAVFFKQIFVSRIHKLVSEGIRCEADIAAALGAPSFPLEGTNDVISFDISSEYLSEVISDLRKAEILSGKDGKIKTM
ncbi:MAG TPA: hypothetical protein O0X70_00770 [Methanocorpusculum sp.]|nr:hypothetical protein [Methanocorpusculum sp.]